MFNSANFHLYFQVFNDQPGTEARCDLELAKSQAASDWLARFLAHGQYRRQRVKVAQLQMAPMDEVSLLNKVFSHNKRRPSSGEWILLEEMIQGRGNLVQFVDKCGRMYREKSGSGTGLGSGSGSGSACSLDNRELLEAFVHFTYQASGGQLVVCGLEGLEDEQGALIVKTPVIHSRHKGYGETDQGLPGIQRVMSRHVCNQHCRRILRPHHVSSAPGRLQSAPLPPPSSPSPSSSPPAFARQYRSPSAPFDPDVVFGNEVVGCRSRLPSAPPYEDLNIDICQLPLEVFTEQFKLLFRLELDKGIPDEPPPPYTERVM